MNLILSFLFGIKYNLEKFMKKLKLQIKVD